MQLSSKRYGKFGNYCWCDGQIVAYYLDKLGFPNEARALYEDYFANDALKFGGELIMIADEIRDAHIESVHDHEHRKDEHVVTIKATGQQFDCTELRKALETIDNAGRWYTAVGEIGSGVEVRV